MGAKLVLIVGPSGSGKSSSIRYLDPETTAIITPNPKELPIPGLDKHYVKGKNRVITSEINQIGGAFKHISEKMPNIKVVILEDLNHFFNARVTSTAFRKRNAGGEAFARWNDFGADVASNLVTVANGLREDLTIFVFAHTDVKDDGKVGMKTSGKLLDNSIDVPSYVTVMLQSMIIEESGKSTYKFLTNGDGIHQAKSPAGMFKEKYIANDLKKVLVQMKNYREGKVEPAWID